MGLQISEEVPQDYLSEVEHILLIQHGKRISDMLLFYMMPFRWRTYFY